MLNESLGSSEVRRYSDHTTQATKRFAQGSDLDLMTVSIEAVIPNQDGIKNCRFCDRLGHPPPPSLFPVI
jgi:hypothetical protein